MVAQRLLAGAVAEAPQSLAAYEDFLFNGQIQLPALAYTFQLANAEDSALTCALYECASCRISIAVSKALHLSSAFLGQSLLTQCVKIT